MLMLTRLKRRRGSGPYNIRVNNIKARNTGLFCWCCDVVEDSRIGCNG